MTQRTYRDPSGRSTTTGELGRDTWRGRHRCVRCGDSAPAPELFICADCEADPSTLTERREAEEAFVDSRDQRAWLKANGWYGGWWR